MSELKSMICPSCGAPLDMDAYGQKCPYCGVAFERILSDSEKTATKHKGYTASFSAPNGKSYSFIAGTTTTSPQAQSQDPFVESAASSNKSHSRNQNPSILGKSARQITAILLAFFLGGVGAEYFYLKKTARGVFSLLFFWTAIPAIVGFFNAIIFTLMHADAFAAKYPE